VKQELPSRVDDASHHPPLFVAHDGPTPASIAAAYAAQQREREAFTEDTGIQVSSNGQLRRPS